MILDFKSLDLGYNVKADRIDVLCMATCESCQRDQVVVLSSLFIPQIHLALGFMGPFGQGYKWECLGCGASSGMPEEVKGCYRQMVNSDDFREGVIRYATEVKNSSKQINV